MFAQAQLADLDTVWGVIERCRADLKKRGIFQWDLIYPTRDLVAQDIQNGKLYAMIVSARVIAVVTVDTAGEEQYKTVEWKTAEPALIVHRLCVEPTLQGRGFGSRMMEYVERYAVRHRCLGLRLDAYSGNPQALTLYRRRGYREAGQVTFPRRALPFICFEFEVRPNHRPQERADGIR